MGEILPISGDQLERFIAKQYEDYISRKSSLRGPLTLGQFRDEWMNGHQFVIDNGKVHSLGIGSHLLEKGGSLSTFLESEKKPQKSESVKRIDEPEEKYKGESQRVLSNDELQRLCDQRAINEKNDAKMRKLGLLPKEDSLGQIKSREERQNENFGPTTWSDYEPLLPGEQPPSDVYGLPPPRPTDPAAGEKG